MTIRQCVLGTVFVAATAVSLQAQSPATSRTQGCGAVCGAPRPGAVEVESATQPRYWARAGAQYGYTFASRGKVEDVSDYFAPRVEVVHNADTTANFQWSVIGNFGKLNFSDPGAAAGKLQELVKSTSGLQATWAPFGAIGGSESYTWFAELGGKLNRMKQATDTSQYTYVTQGRVAFGVDLNWKVDKNDGRPITLTLAGAYGYIGEDKMKKLTGLSESYLSSAEVTIVAPLPSVPDFAVIAQGVALKNGTPSWRIGTLVYAPKKK